MLPWQRSDNAEHAAMPDRACHESNPLPQDCWQASAEFTLSPAWEI
jgi:hypothetical protein